MMSLSKYREYIERCAWWFDKHYFDKFVIRGKCQTVMVEVVLPKILGLILSPNCKSHFARRVVSITSLVLRSVDTPYVFLPDKVNCVQLLGAGWNDDEGDELD